LTVASEGNDPHDQVYLRSSMDLPHHVELDVAPRYVSKLSNGDVPAYFAVDARLAWRPNDRLELAVVGRNLFDDRHPEFGGGPNGHEVERGVFGVVTYKW
jgi:iron complex outermembrane receptor protein